MNNIYYHDFQIGFNLWYVIGGIFLGACLLIGWMSLINTEFVYSDEFDYKVFKYAYRSKTVDNFLKRRRSLNIMLIASAIVMVILIFFESYHGILQILANHKEVGNDIRYSIYGACIVVTVMGGITYGLEVFFIRLGSWIHFACILIADLAIVGFHSLVNCIKQIADKRRRRNIRKAKNIARKNNVSNFPQTSRSIQKKDQNQDNFKIM